MNRTGSNNVSLFILSGIVALLCIVPFIISKPFNLTFCLAYGVLLGIVPGIFFVLHTMKNKINGLLYYVATFWFVAIEPSLCEIILSINLLLFTYKELLNKNLFHKIRIYEFLLFIFTIIIIRQIIDSEFIFYTLKHYIITILLFLLAFYVGRTVDSIKEFDTVIKYYAISNIITLFLMLIGLFSVLTHSNILHIKDLLLFGNRPKGFFKDPNVAGPFFYLPAFYYLSKVLFSKHKIRLMDYARAAILPFGIFLSYSRACIGSFTIGSSLVFFFSLRSGKFSTKIIAVLLFFTLSGVVLFSPLYGQVSSRVFNSNFGVEKRTERLLNTISALKDNFLVGVGIQKNLYIEEAHDSYFMMLHRYGIVGFATFWGAILLVLFHLIRSFFQTDDTSEKIIASTLIITIIAHMLTGVVVSIFHWRHFWLTLGLSFAFLRRNEAKSLENGPLL